MYCTPPSSVTAHGTTFKFHTVSKLATREEGSPVKTKDFRHTGRLLPLGPGFLLCVPHSYSQHRWCPARQGCVEPLRVKTGLAIMAESTYQFSCPSCSALLQAVLKQALTSVQCGECFDVFDVQMPSQYATISAQLCVPCWFASCGSCGAPHGACAEYPAQCFLNSAWRGLHIPWQHVRSFSLLSLPPCSPSFTPARISNEGFA